MNCAQMFKICESKMRLHCWATVPTGFERTAVEELDEQGALFDNAAVHHGHITFDCTNSAHALHTVRIQTDYCSAFIKLAKMLFLGESMQIFCIS